MRRMGFLWALILAVGCGPKLFFLAGVGENDWGQTGGRADGRAFRPKGVDPPVQLLWSRSLNAAPMGGALFAGGLLLQPSARPSLYAFDRLSGQRLGKQGFDEAICGAPALAGEVLILAVDGREARLRGIDRRTRKERWNYPGRFCTDLAVVGDTLLAAEEGGTLVALDATDGRELWTAEIGGRLRVGPSAAGGGVYVGNGSGELVAVEAVSGAERWRHSLESGVRVRPVVREDRVFAGTAAGRIAAFDGLSGEKIWAAELGTLPAPGMALGAETLVVGAADRRIYGLDPDSGTERWRFETDGAVRGAPVATGATAYCGSSDGHLYALELASGRLLWKYRLDGPALVSAALGRRSVVITSEKGTIHVFGVYGRN